jgi:hypothetical protein
MHQPSQHCYVDLYSSIVVLLLPRFVEWPTNYGHLMDCCGFVLEYGND